MSENNIHEPNSINIERELSGINFSYLDSEFNIVASKEQDDNPNKLKLGVIRNQKVCGEFIIQHDVNPNQQIELIALSSSNYTLSQKDHVPGLMGNTIQEIVEKTGFVWISPPPRAKRADRMYARIDADHRDNIEVKRLIEKGEVTYQISRK